MDSQPENLLRIVRHAMAQHDIRDDALQPILNGLSVAAIPGAYFVVQAQRRTREERDRREAKIATLEKVLEMYGPGREKSHPAMEWPSDAHALMQLEQGLDLENLLANIEGLLSVERTLLRIIPPSDLPRNKPPSNKAKGAEWIFEELTKRGTKPWSACDVIAGLFIEAGIESKPAERVRRALYDQLNRTVG